MYTAPSAGQRIRSDIKKYGYIGIKIKEEGAIEASPFYIDGNKEKKEDLDIFMIDNILSRKIRRTAMFLLIVGVTLLSLSYGLKKSLK